ncbi:hypothetical protein PanWU01x14_307970 [Parasponia andersonii]|uniref:Uncharacterized protein n=1 Tax=Parasponia andersonii TaxID=3476 RepID=A0A2P5AR96_PARAD|nr:hypothetical protein PanWU01x14_307970 [Parasponia andersonii]
MSVSLEFLESNIRVRPDLDVLGALRDLGWYCIGAILWAFDYPITIYSSSSARRYKKLHRCNMSLTASFHWDISSTNSSASIHYSFLPHTSMDFAVSGSNASIHAKDFIIPYQETWALLCSLKSYVKSHE